MSTMLKRGSALLLAAVALSAAVAAASAAGARCAPACYDCESFELEIGGLNYHESVKLLGGGVYQQAYNRHHAHMSKPTHGTYRVTAAPRWRPLDRSRANMTFDMLNAINVSSLREEHAESTRVRILSTVAKLLEAGGR